MTYWEHNGKHESLAAELQKMIPDMGSVKNPSKNKKLERFRKAVNCYYDLYNNGLCNRSRSFSRIFGVSASNYKSGKYRFLPSLYARVEEKMDEIVLEAALEQNLD